MAASTWFFLFMFLCLLGGLWGFWPPERRPYAPFGLLLWLAVLVLGVHDFGSFIK